MSEPKITRRAANDDGQGNAPVNRVVIHATCGGRGCPHESEVGVAANTAAYFAKKSTQASAHYIEDIEDEQHCVPDDVIAWHAPPNIHSIGIEVCGEATYTRDQWLSADVWPAVVKAATRAKELCERFDIPKQKLGPAELAKGWRGICGHVDVSNTWHETTHTDPGPGFPWLEFMALIEDAPAKPKPKPVPPKPTPKPASGPTGELTYGDRSERVRRLQQFMTTAFHAYNQYAPTGYYGDLTAQGLAEFQMRVGIQGGDGRNVGPATTAALKRFGFDPYA